MQAQDTRLKICPRCSATHQLNAPVCQCGHQFRTQFDPPLSQTQAFIPSQHSIPTAPNVYQPVVYVTKDFEWKTKVAWLWLGAVVATTVTLLVAVTGQISGVFLPLGCASACAVGLSRLYKRVNFDGLALTGSIMAVLTVLMTLGSYYQQRR